MNKVGIIGQGHVGATTSLVMAQRGKVGKIVIVDKNNAKAKSEQADLQDQIALLSTDTEIEVQDYNAEQWSKLKDLDIIIFCPGKISALLEHGGERDYELNLTSQMVHEIAPKIKASGFSGIIVTITNPCDVIARMLQEEIGVKTSQVIGTGTGLETARMHHAVGNATGHNYHDIQGYVLGEHGDKMFPAWSTVQVASQAINHFQLDLDKLAEDITDGGYTIFNGKHFTNNGIATWVNLIVEAILNDARIAMPVSAYDPNLKLYIGQVAIVRQTGIDEIVDLALNDHEQKAYQEAAQAIQANYNKVH
ncbi:L-lactate dehydrogenase [Bombilactobacillus folatiphilus]|uniref:L-lactate dehydrogenase n=1 Tax=Bombilactobacillus folatiphilus TaxID=2923362 RepID=A0ABY4PAU7_9LACO|nr:L-lactate dehydrogenase [Bombilactobacillus folatiphilus]UQS82750.1 L-lactate dehydrogenase [Bombilactobacillus folatiphilus]